MQGIQISKLRYRKGFRCSYWRGVGCYKTTRCTNLYLIWLILFTRTESKLKKGFKLAERNSDSLAFLRCDFSRRKSALILFL